MLFQDPQRQTMNSGSTIPQNQYLQGNPVSSPTANTSWMEPNQQSGSQQQNSAQQPQSTPAAVNQNQGTMLGQMSSGGSGNWNPAWDQQMRNDYAEMNNGQQMSDERFNYYKGKAGQPDLYSDGVWREGYNPYWKSTMAAGYSGSSDPRLAGNSGNITDPNRISQLNAAVNNGYSNNMAGDPKMMGGQNMQQMMPMLMQMMQGMNQGNQKMPQQVSNGSLFGQAGGNNQMDISSMLNPSRGGQTQMPMRGGRPDDVQSRDGAFPSGFSNGRYFMS